MGNTVPPRPRASSREATGGRRRCEDVVVVTEAAAPATASRVVAAAGKMVVVTVKIVMTRKDAEALVARLKVKAQQTSARERKARMAELKGELRRAGSCGGGGAVRPMPPADKGEQV